LIAALAPAEETSQATVQRREDNTKAAKAASQSIYLKIQPMEAAMVVTIITMAWCKIAKYVWKSVGKSKNPPVRYNQKRVYDTPMSV
jgi:hypothetical protein